MVTKREDITRWFHEGQEQGATHIIVVCDTFDWEDYPVYVASDEDVREKKAEHDGKDMQKVMEVYSLSLDLQAQLNEHRAFNYD